MLVLPKTVSADVLAIEDTANVHQCERPAIIKFTVEANVFKKWP